jgi:hypothetical protein
MTTGIITITALDNGYQYTVMLSARPTPTITKFYSPRGLKKLQDAIREAQHLQFHMKKANNQQGFRIFAGFLDEEHVELITDTDVVQVTLALG